MGIVLSILAYIFVKRPIPPIENMKQLNAEQISLIIKSWAIPNAQPNESGQAILIEFFTRFPHNQKKFIAFKDVPVESLKESAAFRSHAGRIIVVFNEAMVAIQEPDYHNALQEVWGKIGESHAKRKIPKEAFIELRAVIVDILCAVCNLNNEEKEAWGIFMDIIYNIVFNKL